MGARFGFVGVFLLFGCTSMLVKGEIESVIKLPSWRRGYEKRRRVFNVDDFGAVGDGVVDDAKAFEEAWEVLCSYPSKAALEFSAGKKYLISPVRLSGSCQSKVTLLISGTILAPDDPSIWEAFDPQKWLYFHGISQLTLDGGGTINGMGERWWAQSCKTNPSNPCHSAPTAVYFHKCNNLRVNDLVLLNSQQMHMAFHSCSQVKVSNLKVIAPADSPNTDGIHISGSTSVIVRDSTIRTGDDCISIVSLSSNVRITNIVCGPGHGISIGSLGKSKGWDQVHDVQVDGALLTGTTSGARIKTWQGGKGFAHGITFRNILMRNVSHPIIIDQYYCDKAKCKNQTDAVKVSGISFMGIKGTSATETAIKFACSESYACEGIFLEDVELTLESGGAPTAYCLNALGFSYGNVVPPSCLSDSSMCSIKQKVDMNSEASSL